MGRGTWIEPVPLAVDRNVVVIPTQRGQIVGIMAAELVPRDHVVWFESVPGAAAVDDAATVAMEHKTSNRGRDGSTGPAVPYRLACPRPDEFDPAAAQDPLQRGRPDARSGGNLGTGLPIGGLGKGGIDEHTDKRSSRTVPGRCAVEAVLGKGDQRIGGPLTSTDPPGDLAAREGVGALAQRLLDDPAFVAGEFAPQSPSSSSSEGCIAK